MTHEILTAARLLSAPGQIIEVRAITDDGVASGYFDSPEELAAKVEALEGLPTVQGIYVTLNPVNPALFSRRANRIKMRLQKKDATTADSDIVRRQWLPVDIDSVRPSGVSSTEEEHNAAIATARRVAEFLTGKGFPSPILADSGNGAHLLYSIDLPNDDASRLLVKRCLVVLDTLFSDDRATIDTANFNAARIWKLYGTMSRKGDNTADRPHRRSAIIDAPLIPVIVGQDVLERLAGALPTVPVASDAGNPSAGHKIVLRQWLSDHSIGVNTEKPYEGGTLYQLDECPFSDAHKDGAYAIQFPNGACYAGCHHDTCGSGKQRWQELRERYEPKAEKYRQPQQPEKISRQENTHAAPSRLPPGPSPVPVSAEVQYRAKALEVLEHGDPVHVVLETFLLDHEGDEIVAECLAMSFASRSVENTKGLHVSVTGETGKGKSVTFDTFLLQVPERFKLVGAMSNKALFYIENLQPGTAIVFDDKTLSDDMQEILKSATSTFKKPIDYRTVNKDRKPIICTIPERCVWWVAKVEGAVDDQVFNRMLTCWIDESSEQDRRVLNRVLGENANLPVCETTERPEVQVCQAMWEIIGEQRFHIVIPFARRIRFQATSNRRNPEMLLDLIKSHALVYFMQRERQDSNGKSCLIATREDFNAAVRLYSLLNGTTGGQTTKLTRKESDLIATIERSGWAEFTIAMLQKSTGLSNGAIHRYIHGYNCRGTTYSGLLEKCPAITYCDRTVVLDVDIPGMSMRRRTNAYTFDPELFRLWRSGGSVWIDVDDPKTDEPVLKGCVKDTTSPETGNPLRAEVSQREVTSSTSQQLFSNSSTTVEEIKADATIADCEKDPLNTYLGTYNQVLFNRLDLAGLPVFAHSYIRDPEIVEEQDLKTAEQVRNAGFLHFPSPDCSSKRVEEMPGTPGFVEEMPGSPTTVTITARRTIHTTDYKPLDVPEPRTSCYSCGKKGSWYVEKLTAERKSRPKDQQDARRVCRKCYDIAVRRDRAAAPPLPGMIDLHGMERHSPNIGKCSVCNLGVATYLNKETGVKLCEPCHTREVQRQCSSSEVRA
jgi:hypothetical protein